MHLCSFLLLHALCSVSSFHSMHHASFVRFHLLHTTCFYPHETLSTTTPHLFSVLHFYILCASTASSTQCLCMFFNTSLFFPTGCSLPLFLTTVWLTGKNSFTSLFSSLSHCRVIYLIIIRTLHLLYPLAPCVHHHWAYPEILFLLWQ
jgi:hypothetical protein